MSGNEARVAGWWRPAGPVVSNDRGMISQPAPVNLADDGAWAGAVPGTQLIVKLQLLLWTGGCSTGGADIDWLLELVGWHCDTATQRAGVNPSCWWASLQNSVFCSILKFTYYPVLSPLVFFGISLLAGLCKNYSTDFHKIQ